MIKIQFLQVQLNYLYMIYSFKCKFINYDIKSSKDMIFLKFSKSCDKYIAPSLSI